MKRRRKGFTIVELLTAIAIIAVLIGILVPSLTAVRNMAKNASQKAQFMAIETGLLAYRNDFGDYPPSVLTSSTSNGMYDPSGDYCGAQKLAEAMLGADLMGFNQNTLWRAENGNYHDVYYPKAPPLANQAAVENNLKQRKGHYIDLEKANAFRLGNCTINTQFVEGVFQITGNLAKEPYVLCDVYGVRKLSVGGKNVKAGTPILYYKANTTSKMLTGVPEQDRIYNFYDNYQLMRLGTLTPNGSSVGSEEHPFAEPPLGVVFYQRDIFYGIGDSRMTTAKGWPHNPDSYILISAGPDGEYGTADDVRNFGN